MSGMSCSITNSAAPVRSRMSSEQRAERLGLALGDARRRLVEQEHAGLVGHRTRQVDHAAGAGGQLADELVGEGLEVHLLDELVDPAARTSRSAARVAGDDTAAATGSRVRMCRSSATAMFSVDGHRREQPGVLERSAEAAHGPGVGRRER